ncbi:DUF350 domain-containing protein [Mycobacterium sp. OTB74]|uniref:DUF350 domain-containing protein n=1 Tax=Mycobacterium sp. OTB74 TaxID=1853452 RepID=UPI0024771445|nr:DUF350 domain-containing protein [Mycobacterium sp. OTB74]MDH6242936.1 uncharacterized membrane protein YjfL (UPF0719 family) [Mycobacterium sp. OTB74]
MYLAAIDFGTVNVDVIIQNVVSSVLYFLIGVLVLTAGFAMVDVLTPGKLRRQVFVERRPNAVAVTAAMDISLAAIIICAIRTSSDHLGQGLIDTLVYGLIGVALQGLALMTLELLVPGHFRGEINAEEFHPAALATAVVLLAVGGINAAALT